MASLEISKRVNQRKHLAAIMPSSDKLSVKKPHGFCSTNQLKKLKHEPRTRGEEKQNLLFLSLIEICYEIFVY